MNIIYINKHYRWPKKINKCDKCWTDVIVNRIKVILTTGAKGSGPGIFTTLAKRLSSNPVTKDKGSVVSVPNYVSSHEDKWVSGGIAPRIFDLISGWKWVVSFTPRPPYPQGKSARYRLDRRLSGSQSRPGRGGKEKTLSVPGIEPWSSIS
jgi:hypothetical protein